MAVSRGVAVAAGNLSLPAGVVHATHSGRLGTTMNTPPTTVTTGRPSNPNPNPNPNSNPNPRVGAGAGPTGGVGAGGRTQALLPKDTGTGCGWHRNDVIRDLWAWFSSLGTRYTCG